MDRLNNRQETQSVPVVLRFEDSSEQALVYLLERYQINLVVTKAHELIPGSFWGDEEAGLIGNQLTIRHDTPLHSILHEACHYICMPAQRRALLHTNAGGDYDEENAVCYLQILLADELPDMGSFRMKSDMDAWGYSFRLGSAASWFEQDAQDARDWLLKYKLIGLENRPTFLLR